MKILNRASFLAFFSLVIAACGDGQPTEQTGSHTYSDGPDASAINCSTYPVPAGCYDENEDGPREVRMPTSGSGLTPAQVQLRLKADGYSGQGFSQESLAGNRRRWTYWAKPCADGSLWCLSNTGNGTPYSITFQNEVMASADVWQRLGVKFWNASGRWCRLSLSYAYEGSASTSNLFDGTIPYVPSADYDKYATAGRWIWPGTSVSMKGYCHAPGAPSVEYAERTRDVVMTSQVTWNLTYRVTDGVAVIE
jgi:hypothetical protein